MKFFYSAIIFALLGISVASAQVPNGTICPNFTITDLDTNTHSLYEDYLDQGIAVILDLSAAWCAPCWTYHNAHILEDINLEFGPTGTNQIQVLFIESEATNTLQQIYGVTTSNDRAGSTQGDWTQGITYPIADDASVATLLDLSFYPTLYVVRPDRRIFQAYDRFAPNADLLEYYALNPNVNDVGIWDDIDGASSCGAITVNETVDVINWSAGEVTSFDLMVTDPLGATLGMANWTGSLQPFESASVVIPEFVISQTGYANYGISNTNGIGDDFDFINSIDSVFYSSNYTQDTLFYTIRTDFWPEEISWTFTDESNAVLASSADFGTLSCDQEYVQPVAVPASGCITFNIMDSFGDGILNGPINPGTHSCETPNGIANTAMGSISISGSDGTIFHNDIAYGAGTEIDVFADYTVAVRDLDFVNSFAVYPNPTEDILNVEFTSSISAEVNMRITDMSGRLVSESTELVFTGENARTIHVSDFANGMYLLSLTDGKNVTRKTFNVVK